MLEFHPVANIFPLIEGSEFDSFCRDIKEQGLRHSILLHPDGRILDGRNRYRACVAVGIEPRCEEWTGPVGTEVAFVLSANLHRRHLSESQRGVVLARIATLEQGRPETGKFAGLTQPNAAELLNVSERTGRYAKFVLENGTPELIRAVEQDKIAVSQAAKLVKEDAAVQREIVGRVDHGKKAVDALKEVRKEASARALEEAASKNKNADLLKSRCRIIVSSMQDLLANVQGVDAIVTDPPYEKSAIPLYGEMAAAAKRAGIPVVAVMCGQTWLPQVMAAMCEHLEYRWTLAYLTPGGQSVQAFPAKVNCFWKPILLFGESVDWLGDVCKSDTNDNDKTHHEWGQSESGMLSIVGRLTKVDDLVCDPFCGAGTTAVAALKLNRRFVGCDKEASCVKTAWQRVTVAYDE